jgi:hypothetical protein
MEKQALLPSRVSKALPKITRFKEMIVTGLAGSVEPSGDDFVLTARGSNQKYALPASEALRKFVASGKLKIAVTGKVDDPPGEGALPVVRVTDVRELSDK